MEGQDQSLDTFFSVRKAFCRLNPKKKVQLDTKALLTATKRYTCACLTSRRAAFNFSFCCSFRPTDTLQQIKCWTGLIYKIISLDTFVG